MAWNWAGTDIGKAHHHTVVLNNDGEVLQSRRGNKQLKQAFFLSAFASLGDPASRAYYDKKITQGKHHTQALLCLARRRADVLFAMLRDGTAPSTNPSPPQLGEELRPVDQSSGRSL